jgi:hypothetical protein
VSPGNPCSFFTLYEVETLGVLSGAAYTARLNAPTPATQANIVNFRNTIRSLAAVVASAGVGLGGALMTLRFEADDGAALATLVPALAAGPRMLGAPLCRTDDAASGIVTREKQGRTDLLRPPGWFLLAEATDLAALEAARLAEALTAAGARAVAASSWRLEQALA